MSKDNKQVNAADLQKLLSALQQAKPENSQPTKHKSKKSLKELASSFVQTTIIFVGFLVHFIDRFINFISKSEDPERSDIMQFTRSPILFGASIVFIFVILGGFWATTAPLDSAAHATGTIMSISNRQVVQHSGNTRGIVKNILVKQGDLVNANEVLVEFDETQARQNYDISLNRYLQSLALESRLIAERDKLPKVEFNPVISQFFVPEVAKMMQVQINIFNSRKEHNEKVEASNKKEIEKINQKLVAFEENKKSLLKALELQKDKVQAFKSLVAKGYAAKTQLDTEEIKEAEISTNFAHIDSNIANSEQDIAKLEIQISRHNDEFMTNVLHELKETQAKIHEFKEHFAMAQDELDRCTLRSPIEGKVNEISVHTIGAVVGPGTVIAEITPIKDQLVIDAKIQPNHIGSVTIGQKAKMKFLAFKSRTSPTFIGTVTSISPDTVLDQQTAHNYYRATGKQIGDRFYQATIEIDMENFEKIAGPMKLKLVPGMMADINIVTGTRTLFRYLIDPIADQAFKAFNEK